MNQELSITLFYICLKFNSMNTESSDYYSLKKTPINVKVHYSYGFSCHFEKQALIISTKLNQSYNEWELVLKMNYSLRIVSVKKNHINISLYTRHDKILYDFRRCDWKAISFMRSWSYDVCRKDLQKFPVGIVILSYSI